MQTSRSLSLLLAALLVVAGCGASDDDPTEGDEQIEAPSDGTEDPTDDGPAPDGEGDGDDAPAADGDTDEDVDADEDPGTGDGGDGAAGGDTGTDHAEERGPEAETGPDAPDVPPLHPQIDDLDEIVVTIATGDDDVRVDAKLAADTADRQRGLMEVTDLPAGVGMLFLFEEEREGGFWMKNTLVPLDIAYSSEDGEILEILTMEPCEADPCPSYDPGVSYLTALEVPAGWFDEVGVATGDELTWSEPVAVSGAQG